jgi:RNA polymerase sigma-70 factor (ECF subfamily)
VARFQVLTHAKRLGRERLVFDEELMESLAAESQLQAASMDQRRDALLVCLERLPVPQRQLLDMRYSLGQSLDQIASALSRPSGSVRQTLYRVREALLSCIERRMAGEASS